MREVDHALAKAFSLKPSALSTGSELNSRQDLRSVIPAPHFTHFESSESPNFDAPEAASCLFQWPRLVLQLEQDFRARYTALADSLIKSGNPRSLLFTSRQRAEGRTTLVLALAREFAARPGRTLIVDSDFSHPSLARLLSVRPTIGLEEVVRGLTSLEDAILDSPLDRLSLLPLRKPVVGSRAFLRIPRFRSLLLELREKFDRILIDGGPVYSTSPILSPGQPVDAVVLVRNQSLTDARRLGRAKAFVETKGYPIVGLAETHASAEPVFDRGATEHV